MCNAYQTYTLGPSMHWARATVHESLKGLNFARLVPLLVSLEAMSAPKQVQMDSIDESKVIVYSACFLCYNGLIPEFNNIGCAVHETFLCLDYEACLKPGQGLLKMPDGIGICCGCCAVKLIPITTCIKAQSQFFCCVSAAALPPDGEVPMMFSICFLSLFPKVGCLKKLAEMKG
eukprot:Skav223625  [mRNA]  locus=scaffold3504:85781:87377:- [translate_table: standard]